MLESFHHRPKDDQIEDQFPAVGMAADQLLLRVKLTKPTESLSSSEIELRCLL